MLMQCVALFNGVLGTAKARERMCVDSCLTGCSTWSFQAIECVSPASQVMEMLDRLYGKFDRLTKKHNLFKVPPPGSTPAVVFRR